MSESQGTASVEAWERAYRAFETPEEERRKFVRRLRSFGVDDWEKDLRIVELFCGRGNGLFAWTALGFTRVEGADWSLDLVRRYSGGSPCVIADARRLPYPESSRDVVCVQGGLHHLPSLEDLDRTLGEVCRVLKPEGRVLFVEPWDTPFLRLVHRVSRSGFARRLSVKMNAFEEMYENERETYDAWLGRPDEILTIVRTHIEVSRVETSRGKLRVVGKPAKA